MTAETPMSPAYYALIEAMQSHRKNIRTGLWNHADDAVDYYVLRNKALADELKTTPCRRIAGRSTNYCVKHGECTCGRSTLLVDEVLTEGHLVTPNNRISEPCKVDHVPGNQKTR